MDLLDYVTRSSDAETVEDLNDLLSQALKDLCGLTRYVFGLETDHHLIGLSAGHGLMSNYPMDWMKYYIEKNYVDVDPVRRYGHNAHGPFSWADIPADYYESRRSRKCFYGGKEAGLTYGVCAPLRGPFGQIAGLAAASDDNIESTSKHSLAIFNVICQQFYTRFIELHKPDDIRRIHMPKLAPREKDVLAWVARGKTNTEISDILRLSPHYVREIVAQVMSKYNASTRVSAVLMAIFNGEIDASDLVVRPPLKVNMGSR